MKKTRKILWGVGFLLAAVLLIVGSLYYIQVLDIILMLAALVLLIAGISHRNFVLILPSAALLIINGERLGLPEINPWTVLVAALLGGIGLNVLFPSRKRHWNSHKEYSGNCFGSSHGQNAREPKHGESVKEFVQTNPEEEIHLENTFGETAKYLTGEMPGKVHLKNTFGSMSVYFDNAVVNNGNVCVYAESSFGNIVLYIPAAWHVVVKGEAVFGDISEKGHCSTGGGNTLEIRGEVSFGNIEVRYI